MGRKAAALRTSAKHCHFSRPHLHQQFYLFLLQALRAAFLPVVSDLWGRVWKGKPCCPFPRLRRFGTHSETGSKFLLLFSIKSKGERLWFRRESSKRANAHLRQAKSCRDCAQSVRSTAAFLTCPCGFHQPNRCLHCYFSPQKKTPFGSFSINHTSPSGSHKKYAPAWRYTPSDNLRS